ncbi:MAG: hypothetical protein ACXVW4_10590 [Nocardioides sp.]
MSTLGRRTLLWMIPLNLLLVVWVWIGRVVFGVFGWFGLILAPVALVMLIALLVTTVLAFTQDGRPRALTRFQAWAQLSTWASMLVFGAFLPDFGDTEGSHISLLTQVFGSSDTLLSVSYTIAFAAAAGVVVSWVVLLVALIGARRKAGAEVAPA